MPLRFCMYTTLCRSKDLHSVIPRVHRTSEIKDYPKDIGCFTTLVV